MSTRRIACCLVPVACCLLSPAHADDVSIPIDLTTPRPRFAFELESFVDAQSITASDTTLRQFVLDRGEVGAAVALGPHAGAELRLESIRSAVDGGDLGVDGDSLVVRVKRAQLYADTPIGPALVGGAIGVVADPWIAALEQYLVAGPLSPTASEGLLGWPTGDVAALGRAVYGPARVTVEVGNGEGLSYPERNDGQTTTAVGEGVVAAGDARLRLIAMARDGSIGPASVRDHRFGGGATLTSPLADAGVEAVRAYGVFDRGDADAVALAGWAEARPLAGFAVDVRGATVGFDAGGRSSTFGGAVAVEPWHEGRGRMRVWLAVDRTTSSGAAMPLPGADPGTATTVEIIVSATAPYAVN